jgi:hypothetical protein
MVGRYLKSLLRVLLFGGLVGPFFLIIYFVFETPFDRQSTGWMVLAGLLVTGADVLIALGVASNSAQRSAKRAALEQHGVLAFARITGMAETGTSINDQPVVKLALQIAGPGFDFDAQKRVMASVTRMGNLHARKLVVLVDPATQDYEVDWERSALVNGLVPATFTLSDDGRTYDLTGQAEPLMEILQILKASNIALDGPLDLRSNPALRHRVQDAVRRAAAAQSSPAQPSPARRMQELNSLRAMEAISDQEYAEKRRRIISEI